MLKVTCGKLPGKLQEVALENGATVDDALRTAGVSKSNGQVEVNGTVRNGDFAVKNGDTVLVVGKIRGN